MELAPWHLEVQVTPELSTRVAMDADTQSAEEAEPGDKTVHFHNPRAAWLDLLRTIYPNGLEGRTVLDCACNCGAYSFWAKESGAGDCLGFDVRELWMRQAEFLAKHRSWPTDGMRFELLDLYDLPTRGLAPFDIAFFLGIFYHLPDPISALKTVADLTRELLVLDTNTRNDLPDGLLAASQESQTLPLSGVYGLNWLPSGPDVLRRILMWLGFVEVRVAYWRDTPQKRADLGRIRVVAAREPGLLDGVRQTEWPAGRKAAAHHA